MKILDLRLQAFGPFLKEQHIDFSSLNDKGMFLINGPTGTGKTSIFDAIVYALYGQGSGSDRDNGKSLRSDFAKDEDVTFVELTFEANGQIYKILRKGEYYRKALRGDKLTLVQGQVELTMSDGSVISGNKNVEEKILNDILFINIKQFKNIALLAQGEFTELVTAKTPERAKILEHIFQKEIYDQFQDKLTEKSKKAETNKNSVISSINTLITQVEGGEVVIGYQEALNEPSNIPAFVEHLEELINKLKEEKTEKEKVVEELRKVYEEAFAKLKAIKQNNELLKKYFVAMAELETLNSKQAEIEELKKKLEVQLEVDNLSPFINQQEQLSKELKEYQDNIVKFEEESKRLASESEWIKNNQTKYDESKKQITVLEGVITNLDLLMKRISSLLKEKEEISQKEGVFATNFAKFQEKEEEFRFLRAHFFASFSHNLAKELEEGKPCPVCGSIHHPHLAELADPVDELTFKAAETKFKQEEKNINDQRVELAEAQSTFHTKLESIINELQENGFPHANEEFVFGGLLNKMFTNLYNDKQELLLEVKHFVSAFERRQTNFKTDTARFEQQVANNSDRLTKAKEKLLDLDKKINELFVNNVHVKSMDTYNACLRAKINTKQAKDVIEQHNSKLIAVKTIIENTPKKLIEVGSVDESSLVQETNEKNNAYTLENKSFNELSSKIDNLVRSVKSIKAKYDECKDIINQYTSLAELAKIANGNNRMKLSFKMYILADYFDKIIVQANKRLHKITNGRYKLIRRDTVKGGGQQGLDLDVYDVETGKNRPASSLSGGEKFVSALSMALGLSDIIETNHALIQVESIFIDEGFGSLDENYLDMAMKALETLKEDNKTIAIISHVEKLKEYIPDGIEVKKDTIGSKIVLKESI